MSTLLNSSFAFLHERVDDAARPLPIRRSTAAQPCAHEDFYGVVVAGERFRIAFEYEHHTVAAGADADVPSDFADLLQAIGGDGAGRGSAGEHRVTGAEHLQRDRQG